MFTERTFSFFQPSFMLSLLAETFSGDFAGADHLDFYIYVHECLFEKIKKKWKKVVLEWKGSLIVILVPILKHLFAHTLSPLKGAIYLFLVLSSTFLQSFIELSL